VALLEIQNLSVAFETARGPLIAVDRLNFHVNEGETLGIVGESGSGKSVSCLSILGLLPPQANVKADRMTFAGKSLMGLSEREYREIRGGQISMIFQDPMSSLDPSYTVGFQLVEGLRTHENLTKKMAKVRALELLDHVGIASPLTRFDAYPHQLSGGMCQRVMIAMAIASKPKLLIADEPTTALDVTIQAQILDLLSKLQREEKMAMILITHNIAVVAERADRVLVMYAGQAVETGPVREVIGSPEHPYTQALLSSLPGANSKAGHRAKLPAISGVVPDLAQRPEGCQMHPRCPSVQERCKTESPPVTSTQDRSVRCFYPLRTRKEAR
jgi:dipeptide transport system ATP-binding protein